MTLRAGEITARYDAGDLREIRIGDTLACLRVYHAVRDRNWATVPGQIVDERIEAGADRFQIAYTSLHRAGEIDFSARVTITGSADGTIVYAYDGVARTSFLRNRIGLCVLHPATAAGDRVRLRHVDGSESDAVFPERIRPEQPVEPFARLAGMVHTLASGARFDIALDGDTFEMEDQRNWSDASYKTFCTPLSLPYPVEVAAGARVRQSVTLRLLHPPAPSASEGVPILSPRLVTRSRAVVPDSPRSPRGWGCTNAEGCTLGLAFAAWSPALDGAQIERLRALRLAHLRVDARQPNLARACRDAHALGVPLELAVRGGDLRAVAAAVDAPIARVLALPESERMDTAPDYERLAGAARAAFPNVPLFLGTDSDFLFVNRFPPPMDLCDGLVFTINPQVHAFDDASIRETLDCYPALIATARAIAGGKPVAVGALTLLPRWNPYASVPLPRDAEPPTDPRHGSDFAAAWFADALRALAGVDSVTVAETHGPRGVLDLPLERAMEARG